MIKFKQIREDNRYFWLAATNRKRYINDVTMNSLECNWQTQYTTVKKHNNFYCSIAEWNTHITDILSDTQFDKYDFETPRYNKALFRHYTRLLLITSEIITDFQDFIVYLSGKNQAQVRNLLSIPGHSFQVSELFGFINNICKHKTGTAISKYHCYNNHIDYFFKDSGMVAPINSLNIKNLSSISPRSKLPIEIMEMESIIDQILNCYQFLNNYLATNYNKITTKLSRYEI